LCHVVSASNQKMKEQSVSSRFVWRYSFSQLSIRNLGYLVLAVKNLGGSHLIFVSVKDYIGSFFFDFHVFRVDPKMCSKLSFLAIKYEKKDR
jgi:hypothetical protein